MTSHREKAARALREHGTTYAKEAGITLRDKPAPLFQLLILTLLFSAPIGARAAVRSAHELFAAGWRTPAKMRESTWQQRVDALGRGGYRRYDESTATYLQEVCEMIEGAYSGDLRGLRRRADADTEAILRLVQEFPRIGSVGAQIFCREVQEVWPEVRPFFDARALAGARKLGLPSDAARLADLVAPQDIARFASALVRVELE